MSVCRPARCFHAVIPGDGYLTLILEPTALGPLLAELVPRDVDGEVHGTWPLLLTVTTPADGQAGALDRNNRESTHRSSD